MTPLNALPEELSIYSVSELRLGWLDWLMQCETPDEPTALTLDGQGVQSVDAAGLQVVLALARSLGARGWQLHIASASPALCLACETLGLTHLLGPAPNGVPDRVTSHEGVSA